MSVAATVRRIAERCRRGVKDMEFYRTVPERSRQVMGMDYLVPHKLKSRAARRVAESFYHG